MNCYTREQIQTTMESKGYKYFTGGEFDVNIIGVRNSETKGRVTNSFDDCVTISYKEDGEWKFHCYQATRSEEHTSELQSRLHLVCRLLLEKKKIKKKRKRRKRRKKKKKNMIVRHR